MSRAARTSPISSDTYRNFAFMVIAIAFVIALFAESGSDAAAPPAESAAIARSPAAIIEHRPAIDLPVHEPDDAAGEADAAAADMVMDDGMTADHAPTAMPRTGNFGPADQPSAQQVQNILDASRMRSGSGDGGD